MKKKDAVPWWITEDDFEDGGKYCQFFYSKLFDHKGSVKTFNSGILPLDCMYIKKIILVA